MLNIMRKMLGDSSGATLVEYALILTLVAVIAIVAIKALGQNSSTILSAAAASI